jgi:hypothetical protein
MTPDELDHLARLQAWSEQRNQWPTAGPPEREPYMLDGVPVLFWERCAAGPVPIPSGMVRDAMAGELFCLARRHSDPNWVSLFIEDDGNYFEVATFDRAWLPDLRYIAERAMGGNFVGDEEVTEVGIEQPEPAPETPEPEPDADAAE